MGRGYVVEDTVEQYLSKLCGSEAPAVTGLLIGQSSAQRDFIVMATRTPQREGSTTASGISLDKSDLEWVTGHGRQVSRMLPGGLSVLGVFFITNTEAKDTLNTLRQLLFAVDKSISRDLLWSSTEDDVTDRVTLHINSKTRKTFCRTFDVKDPKSTAKPADWKYQSSPCASWMTVSCSLDVEIPVALPQNGRSLEHMEKCLEDGLKTWTHQIENGVCLFDGRRFPDDTELSVGQKKNMKQTLKAQLLVTPSWEPDPQPTAPVQPRGGTLSVRGAVHTRAFLHSNKPKARLAERLLKMDMVSTVAVRVQMLMEELMAEEENKGSAKHSGSVKASGPVCVCDYQFSDEGSAEVIERLKEILDLEASEGDLDAEQEQEAAEGTPERRDVAEQEEPPAETPLEPKKRSYVAVAMATAIALLASAASLLYLNDE